jgi:hypothetical protein
MSITKRSISFTRELDSAIEGIMIEKEMSRSRVIETLLRESAQIQRMMDIMASEPHTGVFAIGGTRHRSSYDKRKHSLVHA